MNKKLIFYAGLMTSLVGAMIGLAVAELATPDYESRLYQNLHRKFAIVGAATGALLGMGQESVRQLKQQRDLEEQ